MFTIKRKEHQTHSLLFISSLKLIPNTQCPKIIIKTIIYPQTQKTNVNEYRAINKNGLDKSQHQAESKPRQAPLQWDLWALDGQGDACGLSDSLKEIQRIKAAMSFCQAKQPDVAMHHNDNEWLHEKKKKTCSTWTPPHLLLIACALKMWNWRRSEGF